MILRPFQQNLKLDIYSAWNRGHKNVLSVLPTGGGKTVIFSDILKNHNNISCAIAHRQELISQISLSLAKCGVQHRIISPKNVIRWIVRLHLEELGTSFYNPAAPCAAVGVDTLLRRSDDLKDFLNACTLWVMDEAHHVLADNKWGKAVQLLPNAYGLGVTATPIRADGKGLGAHAHGVMHALVEGPTMRELINMGYLSDYRIFCPPSDIDLSNVPIGGTGDYSFKPLKQAARQSHIIGDVVDHYMKISPGKLGVTFATDVETATDIANQFKAKGIKAEVLHAKVKDALRVDIIRRFRRGEIKQIVNVDILGEGFDVPGIEVVSMARPTKSYSLFAQQFGRALRPAEGKTHAIIIDHVNNIDTSRGGHGLPDAKRNWTLDARSRRKKEKDPDLIETRTCPECSALYERFHKVCPYCGYYPEPGGRTKPEHVDGDLTELDPKVLAKMRGEIERIDSDPLELKNSMLSAGAPKMAAIGAAKQHARRQEAQRLVRMSIAYWRAHQPPGCDDAEAYRRFYLKFGVDVMTAQTLGRREAEELAIKINRTIDAIVNSG